METAVVIDSARALAGEWRTQRAERLRRTALDHADFDALSEIGVYALAVPTSHGGTWESPATSTRSIAEALRALAAGDASPVLVAAMHPAVLSFWSSNPRPDAPEWEAQRAAVFATAGGGARWGTVTSEPGSGGDVTRTRTVARPIAADAVGAEIPGARYALTGDKHFGSGTGVCDFMLTTAVPEDHDEPAAFFLDTRAVASGGTLEGFAVTREWDGVGMRATQSHAVRLEACPAVRFAWPAPLRELVAGAAPVNLCVFTGVVLGVVDEAVSEARAMLAPRAAEMRAYERVAWGEAVRDHWLMAQAYEGMLRTVEAGDPVAALVAGIRGKVAAAELAEGVLRNIARVVGGATFSARSPFATWFEDVRALGFLRPPWGLAFDTLFDTSFV